MRLTLRTLLAYLDDRLSPTNAKEIGQKIAKSPFATELTERIRDVVRRRRLATTDESVRMIDANLVAEYLDDQLTPELVARIEQEILKSDASLAEVAATHEIIGLLREPVALEARFRDRLYAMDPSGKLDAVKTIAGSAEPQATSATVKPANSAPEWKPLEARAPVSRKLPAIILGVLAMIWLAVVLTDRNLSTTPTDSVDGNLLAASDPADSNPAVSDPLVGDDSGRHEAQKIEDAENTDIPPDVTVAANHDVAPAAIASVTDKAGNVTDSLNPNGAPSTVNTMPEIAATGTEPASSVAADPTTELPTTVAPNSASTPAATLPAATPAVAENPPQDGSAVSPDTVHPIYIRDEYGMLLVQGAESNDWKRMILLAPISQTLDQLRLHDWRSSTASATLATPGIFDATFAIDNAGWQVEAAGGSLFRILNSQEAGLAPLQGRFIISRTPATDIPDDSKVAVSLKLASGQVELTLNSMETRVAIEVTPSRVESIAPSVVAAGASDAVSSALLPWDGDFVVKVFVIDGALRIADSRTPTVLDLPRTHSATWRSLNTGEMSELQTGDATARAAMLEWASRVGSEPIDEIRKIQAQISSAFTASESVREPVLKLYEDRNPQVGAAAVQAIAVTRDVDTLMTILLQSNEELVRRAAIDGLETVANQSNAGANLVRKTLENRLPMNEVEALFSLINGLTDADARSPAVCADLIALLSSDRLAARELAFYRMEQLVGDRFSYHADSDPGRRREAIRRWQRYVERNDGQLLP